MATAVTVTCSRSEPGGREGTSVQELQHEAEGVLAVAVWGQCPSLKRS